MEPLFFRTPAEFRRWLAKHHDTETELWVGFYKVSAKEKGITYKEAVDEALCYGWIDGLVKSLDDVRRKQRFTPRKKGSTWSLVNIANAKRLIKENRMEASGLKAFEARDEKKSGVYAFENRHGSVLSPAQEKRFKANKKAWAFFQEQPNWYRGTAIWLVISAKKEETREKRLNELIDCSEKGKTIKTLTRKSR